MSESNVPLSKYISPITSRISTGIEYIVNSHYLYPLLYGLPLYISLKQFKAFNTLANLRFKDIGYQIRRVDSISNRWTGIKYFLAGTILVPITGGFLSYKIYQNYVTNKEVNKLIFYDFTKKMNNKLGAINDSNYALLIEKSVSESKLSDSLRRISVGLGSDVNKVKNFFGIKNN